MKSDKRQSVRKRTDQLLYAEFGQGNGSILLNLSEGGCSFQSMAPVREKEPIFTFSVGDGRKLTGQARMAWSDEAGKTGGISFVDPSPELRRQVNEWLKKTLVTVDGKIDPAAKELESKGEHKSSRTRAGRKQQVPDSATLHPDSTASSTADLRPPVAEMTQTGTGNLFPGPLPDDNRGSHSRPGAWRGVTGIAFVALFSASLVAYHQEFGRMVASIGESLAGQPSKPSGPIPAQDRPADGQASPSSPVEVPLPIALPDGQVPEESANSVEAVLGGESVQVVPQRSIAAEKDTSFANSKEVDIPELWNRVESGNTEAELNLADRYLRGVGVARSCAQGRVLLEAAAKRGNIEAGRRLDELLQRGCP